MSVTNGASGFESVIQECQRFFGERTENGLPLKHRKKTVQTFWEAASARRLAIVSADEISLRRRSAMIVCATRGEMGNETGFNSLRKG